MIIFETIRQVIHALSTSSYFCWKRSQGRFKTHTPKEEVDFHIAEIKFTEKLW